jgi:hypothetical protein
MTLAGRRDAARVMRMAPAALRSSDLHARVVKILSPYPSIAPAWSRGIAGGMVAALCLMSVGVGGVKLVEAAALALPFVSPRTFSAMPDARAPVAAAAAPSRTETSPPARRQARTASSPEPAAGAPSPSAGEAVTTADPARTAAIDVQPGIAAELPGTAHALAAQVDVTRDPSPPAAAARTPSPWNAVATGGVAIGRKSKDAGVATAGFFTRFARRVAGSF